MSTTSKRPASQYYWGDWRRDTALQSCSIAARGLWHEMNCLMHDGEPYGHLAVNGNAMTTGQLARLVGLGEKECIKLLGELSASAIFSLDDEGRVFSRRMVRDERIREARAAGGVQGAEHGVKGKEAGSKGGRPKLMNGGLETPLTGAENPPPAFASASASAKPSTHPPDGSSTPPASADRPPLALVSPAPLPNCPHEQIIAAYHRILPMLPRMRGWSETRRSHLAARWKSDQERRSIKWWEELFHYIAGSRFLLGNSTGRDGNKAWVLTLDWLVKSEDNLLKVVEGRYEDQA